MCFLLQMLSVLLVYGCPLIFCLVAGSCASTRLRCSTWGQAYELLDWLTLSYFIMSQGVHGAPARVQVHGSAAVSGFMLMSCLIDWPSHILSCCREFTVHQPECKYTAPLQYLGPGWLVDWLIDPLIFYHVAGSSQCISPSASTRLRCSVPRRAVAIAAALHRSAPVLSPSPWICSRFNN